MRVVSVEIINRWGWLLWEWREILRIHWSKIGWIQLFRCTTLTNKLFKWRQDKKDKFNLTEQNNNKAHLPAFVEGLEVPSWSVSSPRRGVGISFVSSSKNAKCLFLRIA
jgi:hypothetical protein